MVAATAREIAYFQHEGKSEMNSAELYTIKRGDHSSTEVSSVEGHGSTFRLYLPLCEPGSSVVSAIRSAKSQ